MIQFQDNFSLLNLNTFGMHVFAKKYTTINSEEDIKVLANTDIEHNQIMILGGGSNILFTENTEKYILHNQIKGIEILEENSDLVSIRVGAGEVWHQFVLYCVANGFGGVENLSLIPGTVGAAPIQNIGAYGAEVKDVITSVRYWDWRTHTFEDIKNEECKFAYRDSIFKRHLKGHIIITSVVFTLSKKQQFNISYGTIAQELEKMNVQHISIKAISDAVIAIRTAKLPNPKEIGNAGSFFKNPEIDKISFETLQSSYPQMPSYPLPDNIVKIPAAWLIEQCGWKGYRKDDYGVHKNQALVLVNYGNAQGRDIYNLSQEIIQSVQQKFNITLEREVQIV